MYISVEIIATRCNIRGEKLNVPLTGLQEKTPKPLLLLTGYGKIRVCQLYGQIKGTGEEYGRESGRRG